MDLKDLQATMVQAFGTELNEEDEKNVKSIITILGDASDDMVQARALAYRKKFNRDFVNLASALFKPKHTQE